MTLLDQILGRPSEKKLALIAEEVAGRSRHVVWQRVSRRLEVMRSWEAKGYIRARSAVILQRELDTVFQHHRIDTPAQQTQVYQWASEAVVQMIEAQARIAYAPKPKRKQVA